MRACSCHGTVGVMMMSDRRGRGGFTNLHLQSLQNPPSVLSYINVCYKKTTDAVLSEEKENIVIPCTTEKCNETLTKEETSHSPAISPGHSTLYLSFPSSRCQTQLQQFPSDQARGVLNEVIACDGGNTVKSETCETITLLETGDNIKKSEDDISIVSVNTDSDREEISGEKQKLDQEELDQEENLYQENSTESSNRETRVSKEKTEILFERLYTAEKNLEERAKKINLKREQYISTIENQKKLLLAVEGKIKTEKLNIETKKRKIKLLKESTKTNNSLHKIDIKLHIAKSKLKLRKIQRDLRALIMQRERCKKNIEKCVNKLRRHRRYYGIQLLPGTQLPPSRPVPPIFFSDTRVEEKVGELDPETCFISKSNDDLEIEDLTD